MNYLKLVFLVLFVIPSVVVGQKVVNSNFLGNWANPGTGAWEYGFYEDGAVAFSDFWKYKRVEYGKKTDGGCTGKWQSDDSTQDQAGEEREYFYRT